MMRLLFLCLCLVCWGMGTLCQKKDTLPDPEPERYCDYLWYDAEEDKKTLRVCSSDDLSIINNCPADFIKEIYWDSANASVRVSYPCLDSSGRLAAILLKAIPDKSQVKTMHVFCKNDFPDFWKEFPNLEKVYIDVGIGLMALLPHVVFSVPSEFSGFRAIIPDSFYHYSGLRHLMLFGQDIPDAIQYAHNIEEIDYLYLGNPPSKLPQNKQVWASLKKLKKFYLYFCAEKTPTVDSIKSILQTPNLKELVLGYSKFKYRGKLSSYDIPHKLWTDSLLKAVSGHKTLTTLVLTPEKFRVWRFCESTLSYYIPHYTFYNRQYLHISTKQKYPSLDTLVLKANIDSVAFPFRSFPKLRYLDLSENKMLSLSFEQSTQAKIEMLDITGNKLMDFPAGITKIKGLKKLWLDWEQVKNWNFSEALKKMKNLQILDICYYYEKPTASDLEKLRNVLPKSVQLIVYKEKEPQ